MSSSKMSKEEDTRRRLNCLECDDVGYNGR